MNCVCGMQRRVRMIEYIKVVSKQRPAKRAFDMQVGAAPGVCMLPVDHWGCELPGEVWPRRRWSVTDMGQFRG